MTLEQHFTTASLMTESALQSVVDSAFAMAQQNAAQVGVRMGSCGCFVVFFGDCLPSRRRVATDTEPIELFVWIYCAPSRM